MKTLTKKSSIEKTLWLAADGLRKNIDAAEYKHIVLGLIFLKYISDSFENLYNKLKQGQGKHKLSNPEDWDEYKSRNIFFVPPSARWSYLRSCAKLPDIGRKIDLAMLAIEKNDSYVQSVIFDSINNFPPPSESYAQGT